MWARLLMLTLLRRPPASRWSSTQTAHRRNTTKLQASPPPPNKQLQSLLPQPLRWRVLRRVGAAQVRAVEEYVDADLLDAQAGCGLVHPLLTSPNARVQQQAARFLECLSLTN